MEIFQNQLFTNALAVVIFIGIIIVLLYTKRIPQAKKIVLACVIQAESVFGSGTGGMKYSYVVGLVYPKLPAVVKFFVNTQTLNDWIEESVKYLKTELQDNTEGQSTEPVKEVVQPVKDVDSSNTQQN
jgi:hypothetical protein